MGPIISDIVFPTLLCLPQSEASDYSHCYLLTDSWTQTEPPSLACLGFKADLTTSGMLLIRKHKFNYGH